MSKLIFTLILFGALIAWEIPRLRRRNEKKEMIVFLFLMAIGLALSILFDFHKSLQ
jgi:4-hydroxybenzoate polyprenyltransferase